MKSGVLGTDTSKIEVTNVSPHGVWLLLGEEELFAPFEEFPWFRDAAVSSIFNVRMPRPEHLHWPDLDVDLEADSLRRPEKFPLICRG